MLGALRLKKTLMGGVIAGVVALNVIGDISCICNGRRPPIRKTDPIRRRADPLRRRQHSQRGLRPIRPNCWRSDGSHRRHSRLYPTAKEKRHLIAEWRAHGVASAVVLTATTRADADASTIADPFADATGVWISGGTQDYLADIYVDTEVERPIQARLDRGGVVGGVSAGAAVMTQTMIVGGSDPQFDPRGFDLLPGVVVDQHFLNRNRTQRLLNVLARHRDLIGLGIDEHTAVVIERE